MPLRRSVNFSCSLFWSRRGCAVCKLKAVAPPHHWPRIIRSTNHFRENFYPFIRLIHYQPIPINEELNLWKLHRYLNPRFC
ncbi:hypothetical protein PGT21_004031 [Puccinia graminis f. sp. tritici]|uniref:Uncharacterized protein n=1 Tax=Puccinia graminis f. sp. tritici TaxID=56615 RepID=A0A5B0SHV7_PUCGR|nr:hypothetical protein PGT21_004031 [Puccinia graminis f. sp. tritici]KAA1137145.1 hypothetical protein PGTUg99_002645 [Puccinia graminis f. sp. tritici]